MASEPAARWLRPLTDGVLLSVHVGPKASRAGVAGVHNDLLRVRVTAAPAGGAANRELVRVLAELLGVFPSAVSIERGEGSRQKVVRVRGVGPDLARTRLAGGSVDSARARH